MRLKLTLRRASGTATDVVVTVDATVSVGAVAAALRDADPERAAGADATPVTLDVLGAGGLDRPRSIHPDLAIVEAGIRSGGTVQLSRAAPPAAGEGRDRGPAVAVLRVLSGPDEGREFPLPAGASHLGRERGVDVRLSDP